MTPPILLLIIRPMVSYCKLNLPYNDLNSVAPPGVGVRRGDTGQPSHEASRYAWSQVAVHWSGWLGDPLNTGGVLGTP